MGPAVRNMRIGRISHREGQGLACERARTDCVIAVDYDKQRCNESRGCRYLGTCETLGWNLGFATKASVARFPTPATTLDRTARHPRSTSILERHTIPDAELSAITTRHSFLTATSLATISVVCQNTPPQITYTGSPSRQTYVETGASTSDLVDGPSVGHQPRDSLLALVVTDCRAPSEPAPDPNVQIKK